MCFKDTKLKVNLRVAEDLQVWHHVLTAAMKTGFITLLDFLDPLDNKLEYPSHWSKRKKRK